ncbi:hypothetical protein M0805_005968 [Coniferiporia weirii]|nr:hypothetical protein M0805_005968 [Coniferiporia weirii]
MKLFSLATVLAATGFVSATVFTVTVGGNNSLTYNPPSISNVTVGDAIAFQFVAKNHSVTQSTFTAPCTSSGIDSGFFPITAGAAEVPQWSFTVNNASAPLWFFCAQTGHCEQGMVFAVNPTANKTFEAFQAAANGTVSNSTTSAASTGSSAAATPIASVESAVGGGPSTSAPPSPTSAALPNMGISGATGLLAVLGLVVGVGL